MSLQTAAAQIVIATGPGRGQVVPFAGDVLTIGSGEDCGLILEDGQIEALHATIVQRNDRFAIHAGPECQVLIDGNPLPSNQWVWLPSQAVLGLSSLTRLHFSSASPPAPPAENRPRSRQVGQSTVASLEEMQAAAVATAKPKAKSKKSNRQTAQFITERTGETLVRLGEDGHLPNLRLAEADARPVGGPKAASQKEGNPALLYGALGFSLLSSVLLLFLENSAPGLASSDARTARATLFRDFIGEEADSLQPWQRQLREAGLAYSRGDQKAERIAYLRVLKMLNSEDLNQFTGLTGHIEDDERLRKLLATLLE